MFTALENGLGLEIVVGLQAGGSSLLDALATALHFLGGELVYLFLLPVVYWSVDRRLGRYLLLVLVLSTLAVAVGKSVVQAPRPHIAHPNVVRELVPQGGYGFPSGHVANALALWGFMALWTRRRWAIAAAGVYVLLMAWARMYAGVHYPHDAVGGALLGLATIVFAARWAEGIVHWWQARGWMMKAGIVLALCLLTTFVFYRDDNGLAVAGLLLGGGLGVIWEEHRIRFDNSGTPGQRALRMIIGLLIVGGLYGGLRALFEGLEPEPFFRVVRYFIISLFVVAGWPWLAGRAGLVVTHPPAAAAAQS